jgi:hypothetical protein
MSMAGRSLKPPSSHIRHFAYPFGDREARPHLEMAQEIAASAVSAIAGVEGEGTPTSTLPRIVGTDGSAAA